MQQQDLTEGRRVREEWIDRDVPLRSSRPSVGCFQRQSRLTPGRAVLSENPRNLRFLS